jgi:hypothetical protein
MGTIHVTTRAPGLPSDAQRRETRYERIPRRLRTDVAPGLGGYARELERSISTGTECLTGVGQVRSFRDRLCGWQHFGRGALGVEVPTAIRRWLTQGDVGCATTTGKNEDRTRLRCALLAPGSAQQS